MSKSSETITENIFRDFYGANTFVEKSAIPNEYGFKSKNKIKEQGYPDFFKDMGLFALVVEAKPSNHIQAKTEVIFYLKNNSIAKDIIGMAVSGQTTKEYKVTYFLKRENEYEVEELKNVDGVLLSLKNIEKLYHQRKYGKTVSSEQLVLTLKKLNKTFNNQNKVRATDRSLFFSGIMIALKNANFRNTYQKILAPTSEELASTSVTVLEAHNLNNAILNAITQELKQKVNNLSKEYSWYDRFSFIKNIDYPLETYKSIINTIEKDIFNPFQNDESYDVLGKAYKIFLERAGQAENKNIILTPDHIKSLMVKLARLTKDDVVIDTCTGSGGFLMESMETMIKLAKNNEATIKHITDEQLIGFEIDPVLFALACSNMFLHGDGRTKLLFRSSLLERDNREIVNNKDSILYDYIKSLKPTKAIINPPYENNNSIKFTKQALEYLEPYGKLIIIMPTPTLIKNQGGLTEDILAMAKLDFVIKMPDKLFSEQKRTVNTSIFGFTKTPHLENDEVLFYNLEDDGYVSVQHKGRIDKYNRWPDIEQYVLNYVSRTGEIETGCDKKLIYKNGELNCAGFSKKRDSNYKMIKISDVFYVEKGTLASNDETIDGEYNFITAADEWKRVDHYDYDTEALVFAVSAAGSLGKCQYVNGKFVASNLCVVLTKKPDIEYEINIEFYNYYLNAIRKQLVNDLKDGTSKLTIRPNDLESYYIDYIPIEKQNDFVSSYLKEYKSLKQELILREKNINNRINELI